MSRVTGYQRPEQLVAVAMAQPDRNPPPGESFRYCNTDYVLLGLIAEKATGTRVDALVWQRILDPLGLRETTFPVADGWLRGPHATGYVRMAADQPYQEVPVLSPSFAWTSGAMTATPRDLARFFDALLDGRVVDPADLATMTARSEPLDEGRWRGLGLVRYERSDGTVAFGHHGGVPGYTTVALRTAGGRTIVLCQNGIDLHDVLTSDAPFVAAALAGG
jgi:D-alanyl-D-alanine carboxypeptidase